MKCERVYLMENNPDVYLDCYINDPLPALTRSAMLVIPGGGYGGVCSDREGEPIAMAFIPYGYNAFVLHYTVERKKKFPAQLIEAAIAMKYIRENAEKLNIDPKRVFAVGFSAGGHLAGSLGILVDHPAVRAVVPTDIARPTGIILCYPVVSGVITGLESGTFRNLLCTDTPSAEELAETSLELHVTKDAAPLFLMHTSNDDLVDVNNAFVLGQAYHAAGLPFEMHILPDAPHGAALANRITSFGNARWMKPAVADWVRQAAAWAETV